MSQLHITFISVLLSLLCSICVTLCIYHSVCSHLSMQFNAKWCITWKTGLNTLCDRLSNVTALAFITIMLIEAAHGHRKQALASSQQGSEPALPEKRQVCIILGWGTFPEWKTSYFWRLLCAAEIMSGVFGTSSFISFVLLFQFMKAMWWPLPGFSFFK